MPNTLLSVQISRTALGLPTLDLNDHINYYCSSQGFLGASVQWNRQQVTSPFIDGSVTTYRNKQEVTDQLSVEVLGKTYVDSMNKISTLVAAFSQDTYNLQVAFGTAVLQYACEASDYTVTYTTERWYANQVLVTFSFPRQPNPVIGGF